MAKRSTLNRCNLVFISLFLLSIVLAVRCRPDDHENQIKKKGKLRVLCSIQVGDNKLNTQDINATRFTTQWGDTFSIESFKCYLGNIQIKDQKGTLYAEDTVYHLIDLLGKTSFLIENLPDSKIESMSFYVGVDSANNHSITWKGTKGAQFKGDLDPNSNMAWDWTTGYKFLLFEGRYFNSTSTGGIVYHIGTDENYLPVTVRFPSAQAIRNDASETHLNLIVDIKGLFGPPFAIRIDSLNTAMFGAEASKIAQNYINNMFRMP